MDMNRILNYIEEHLEEKLTSGQLADMGADGDTVLAGLFSDISERNETVELSAELPEKVWEIVEKIGLWHTDREHCPEEVVLIKLAERLHNMRTIEYLAEEKRAAKARKPLSSICRWRER